MTRWIISKEQLNYFKSINYLKTNKECAKLMSKFCGFEVSEVQIKGLRYRYKLKSGIDSKFKKGHTAWNKNKKFPGKTNSGSFKKGHMLNCEPIGTIVKTHEYWKIKTGENEWKTYQRYLYEQVHGKIPDKCRIIFLDQNKHNFNIDNLVCVSYKELALINQHYKLKNEATTNLTKILTAKLKIKTNEVLNDRQNKQSKAL